MKIGTKVQVFDRYRFGTKVVEGTIERMSFSTQSDRVLSVKVKLSDTVMFKYLVDKAIWVLAEQCKVIEEPERKLRKLPAGKTLVTVLKDTNYCAKAGDLCYIEAVVLDDERDLCVVRIEDGRVMYVCSNNVKAG